MLCLKVATGSWSVELHTQWRWLALVAPAATPEATLWHTAQTATTAYSLSLLLLLLPLLLLPGLVTCGTVTCAAVRPAASGPIKWMKGVGHSRPGVDPTWASASQALDRSCWML
jgi:hypothetical protein